MRTRFVLIALLVATLAVTAGAKEKKKPYELFAEKEAAFRRAIATKLSELGGEARKFKLFPFARETYEDALKYDPNNKEARKWLGYTRKGGKWFQDEPNKMPKNIQKGQNEHQSSVDKKIEDWKEKKRKTGLFIGRKYSALGTWCAKQGLPDQAKKAWERSIKFDPENTNARKGLGHRKVDGEWLTEKQIRARQEAREGKFVNDTPSRYEDALKIKLRKIESGHFRIESVVEPDRMKDFIKKVETCYQYFVRDVGEPENKEVWGRKATLLVLGTQQQWNNFVDMFGGPSRRQKEFTKKLRGHMNSGSIFGAQHEGAENSTHESTVDGLVHKTGHFLAFHYWNINRAWLLEGFAYYYTVKVLNSTSTHCVALGTYSNPGGGEKKWGESANWKELIKKEVLDNNDPDIRVFHKSRTADLQYSATVKAWSLISWLFDKHREKFMEWLSSVGRGGKGQEQAFQDIFGWTFEEVDREWRQYVRENY
ncbi:MAG: tetratricopeptide repeat protein [Planctomycetota bacterium]|jgi:tetratricopeptide (TPR) repeat protein